MTARPVTPSLGVVGAFERPPIAMYSTCLHCHASLGANAAIEHFPIGRRLVFDAVKGRLWVICLKCHRWNLTPLEQRWEAIDECERAFRSARLRSSTDNIGLARLSEGLELVRIGTPMQPEIAAWRYAEDFRRRWLTRAAPLAISSVSAYALQILLQTRGEADPRALLPVFGIVGVGASVVAITSVRTIFSRLVLPDGRVTTRRRGAREAKRARLVSLGDSWGVRLGALDQTPLLTGMPAVHTLRGVTTVTNYYGGRKREVDGALGILTDVGDPGEYIRRVAHAGPLNGYFEFDSYPPEIRLALEMALHDDVERRAIAGELAALEAEWAMAEEIARIADGLLVPAAISEQHDALVKGMS